MSSLIEIADKVNASSMICLNLEGRFEPKGNFTPLFKPWGGILGFQKNGEKSLDFQKSIKNLGIFSPGFRNSLRQVWIIVSTAVVREGHVFLLSPSTSNPTPILYDRATNILANAANLPSLVRTIYLWYILLCYMRPTNVVLSLNTFSLICTQS